MQYTMDVNTPIPETTGEETQHAVHHGCGIILPFQELFSRLVLWALSTTKDYIRDWNVNPSPPYSVIKTAKFFKIHKISLDTNVPQSIHMYTNMKQIFKEKFRQISPLSKKAWTCWYCRPLHLILKLEQTNKKTKNKNLKKKKKNGQKQ